MIKRLLILSLLMPGAVHGAHQIERDDLSDAQLLEVLAKGGDNLKDPQIGVATYYASRFIGRRTTSGQRYHPDKMTAAHALLPLGTMVTVENTANGQKVSVVINDRCHPRHAVRNLIDLSRAAAQQIGLWGKGAVKVRIVPLEKKHPLDDLLDEGKG
ncbi:MAG: septal ring lytic transglycosylase RlpA family protein [Geobacter sp.]|nr:septal ring lytic transglycosylase RlpA family protein [Geobacter sp.]